ncbi:spore coat protein [Bacillus sp. NPDC077027]|uniref:spore coat protein n=1 Tax=Bacillus sp. NPDC077027 TaxID=3390548 RepID=UPI003D02FC17
MTEENERNPKFKIDTNVDPLTNLLVNDIMTKYNVTDDKKRKLTEEQKEMILKLVEDVQKKANDFVEEQKEKKRLEETAMTEDVKPEADTKTRRIRRNGSLRDRIQQRKEGQ